MAMHYPVAEYSAASMLCGLNILFGVYAVCSGLISLINLRHYYFYSAPIFLVGAFLLCSDVLCFLSALSADSNINMALRYCAYMLLWTSK